MTEHAIWPFVVDQLIQVTLVVAIGTFVASRCVRLRPHLAYVVMLLVLVKCMTPPLIPGPIQLWPTSFVSVEPAEAAVNTPPLHAALGMPLVAEKVAARNPSASAAAIAETQGLGSFKFSTQALLLLVWGLGACCVLLTAASQIIKARRGWQRSHAPSEFGLQQTCDRLAKRLGVRSKVRLLVNSEEFGPLVTGLIRPTIVLPECLVKEGERRDLELAIAHELVHIRRGDIYVSASQLVVGAVWWFHPLVWWANRVMDATCEQCCDDEVIASLQCKPSRYARLLVTVVERKQQLRHVVALPGAQPNNVTAARLARLGKPKNAFQGRTPWLYRILVLLMAVVLLPGKPLAGWPGPDEGHATPTTYSEASQETAEGLFRSKEWEAAAKAYRQIVDAEPENAIAWSRLGYVLHASGDLEEAIVCHRKAASFDQTRAVGLYNVACAEALLGDPDEALVALEAAIDAGYRAPPATILDDADLASLQTQPEFQVLVKRAADVSTMARYRELDFMIGDWQLHSAEGEYRGSAQITADEKGFLITEKWEDVSGTTGTGIAYFDPKLGSWRQTFVGMFGNISHMTGHFEGNTLHMSGESIFPNRVVARTRSTTALQEDGSFTFLLEQSRDEGHSWQVSFEGRYTPVPAGG